MTQGAVDIDWVDWDEESLELRGASRPIGSDCCKLRVFVPDGYSILDTESQGMIAEVTIPASSPDPVEWRIGFALAGTDS